MKDAFVNKKDLPPFTCKPRTIQVKKTLLFIILVGNPFITLDQSKASTLLFAKGEIFIKIGCQILNSFNLLK
jgi:hypothetical protein